MPRGRRPSLRRPPSPLIEDKSGEIRPAPVFREIDEVASIVKKTKILQTNAPLDTVEGAKNLLVKMIKDTDDDRTKLEAIKGLKDICGWGRWDDLSNGIRSLSSEELCKKITDLIPLLNELSDEVIFETPQNTAS